MIESECSQHGGAINSLAKEGKLPEQKFILNGKTYTANSMLTACEWLKKNGVYDRGEQAKWV